MDWTNWISWNGGMAVVYTIISIAVWLICLSEESKLKDKVKHPKLLGAAVALTSCFELGLLAVVPLIGFLVFSYLLEYWHNKLKSKGKLPPEEGVQG